jgi:hypothetical protein
VDAADYVVWRKNENTMNSLPNDPNGGTIGATQYNIWRVNFDQVAAAGAISGAVPEPANLGILLLGTLVISFRRRELVS